MTNLIRRRALARGIRSRINDSTLHVLRARDFNIHVGIAPVLSMTVTLVPLTGGPARDMRMEITYLEGVGLFDVFTYFYRKNGTYQGDAYGIGIRKKELDDFLLRLLQRDPSV